MLNLHACKKDKVVYCLIFLLDIGIISALEWWKNNTFFSYRNLRPRWHWYNNYPMTWGCWFCFHTKLAFHVALTTTADLLFRAQISGNDWRSKLYRMLQSKNSSLKCNLLTLGIQVLWIETVVWEINPFERF